MQPELQLPTDPVHTFGEALEIIAEDPETLAINLADGESLLPAPWVPRMALRGCIRYVNPIRSICTRNELDEGR